MAKGRLLQAPEFLPNRNGAAFIDRSLLASLIAAGLIAGLPPLGIASGGVLSDLAGVL